MPLQYGEENIRRVLLMGSREHEILARLLDTVGDGTGTKNMAAAAATYRIKPPVGEVYLIHNIFANILDDAPIDMDGWGGIAALANGCKFEIRRQEAASPAVVVRDLTDGQPMKDNLQLSRFGRLETQSGATGCIIHVDFKLPAIRLDGDRGESLVFQTQDNLAALVRQEVSVAGLRCQQTA